MDVSFWLEKDKVYMEEGQLMLRVVVGLEVMDSLNKSLSLAYKKAGKHMKKQLETVTVTPGVKDDSYNMDQVLVRLGETQNGDNGNKKKGKKEKNCEVVKHEEKVKTKENVKEKTCEVVKHEEKVKAKENGRDKAERTLLEN